MSEDRTLSNPVRLGILALVILVLAGSALIYGYLERVRERDLQQWEIRLALIADSRVESLRRQLDADLAGLRELANNASLQLYLSQLALEATDTGAEPAQLSYLRNLILAAAQREHLLDEGTGIQANVPHKAHQGLALVDRNGRLVTATPHMPALGEPHRRALDRALETGAPALIELHRDASGETVLGYAVPVSSLQAIAQDGPGGALVAVWRADRDLYPLLRSGALQTDEDETLLVRRDGDQVRYLSPLADHSPPLQHSLPVDSPGMAASLALLQPGHFSRATDYRGRPVLMISRPVPGTPWTLIQQTGLDSALADARQHRRFLLTSFSLLLFFIAAALVAAWRHGSSVRARQTAAELLSKTRRLDAQTQLLHGITDHIDAFTALLDDRHELVFANTPLARATDIPVTEMRGRSLASVIGTDAARRLLSHLDEESGHRPHSLTLDLEIGGREGRYHCTFVPLQPQRHGPATRLLVLHDVTELERAQQRHSELMQIGRAHV